MELAQRLGFSLKKAGVYYALREHESTVIFPTNSFYRFSARVGGSTIDFVKYFCNVDFKGAMEMLIGQNAFPTIDINQAHKEATKRDFVLPKISGENLAVRTYLKSRCIDNKVSEYCMKIGIVAQSGDFHQNIIYLGVDKNGEVKFAAKESTQLKLTDGQRRFKQDIAGSNKAFSFAIPSSKESSHLVVCESPIDCMSYASLLACKKVDWQSRNYLSLGGIGEKALTQYLKDNPHISKVTLALDNDKAGKEASEAFKAKLEQAGIQVSSPIKLKDKDYNDMLKGLSQKEKPYVR